MTIYLYQKSKAEAFNLCERALLKTGFAIHYADRQNGLLCGRKQRSLHSDCIFLDVKLNANKHSVGLKLFSNVFLAGAGAFVFDAGSEESFLEAFHDLLRIRQPDNPFKLSHEDYAEAVGF